MAFWEVMACAFLGKKVLNFLAESREEERKRVEEERRRKNTECLFNDGISESDFSRIVIKTAKKINRIEKVSTDGPIVFCTVRTQSGISEWKFEIDYNDYGHITGEYWLWSDNNDSTIPQKLANAIKTNVLTFIDQEQCGLEDDKEFETLYDDGHGKMFCPYCGVKIYLKDAVYCSACGQKLKGK